MTRLPDLDEQEMETLRAALIDAVNEYCRLSVVGPFSQKDFNETRARRARDLLTRIDEESVK